MDTHDELHFTQVVAIGEDHVLGLDSEGHIWAFNPRAKGRVVYEPKATRIRVRAKVEESGSDTT